MSRDILDLKKKKKRKKEKEKKKNKKRKLSQQKTYIKLSPEGKKAL